MLRIRSRALSIRDVLVIFLLAIIKYHDQKQLMKEGVLVYDSRGRSYSGGVWGLTLQQEKITLLTLDMKQRERTRSGVRLYTLKFHPQ